MLLQNRKKSFALAIAATCLSSLTIYPNLTVRAEVKKSDLNEPTRIRTRRISYTIPKPKKRSSNTNRTNRVRATATRTEGLKNENLPVILSPINHVANTVSSNPSIPVYFPNTDERVTIQLEENLGKTRELIWVQDFLIPSEGIIEIKLPTDSVKLELGKDYRFTVVKKSDSENRSLDIVAQIWLNRVGLSEELQRRLDRSTTKAERAIILAQNGIWFDALDNLLEQNDRYSEELLISLLAQTQLIEILPAKFFT